MVNLKLRSAMQSNYTPNAARPFRPWTNIGENTAALLQVEPRLDHSGNNL